MRELKGETTVFYSPTSRTTSAVSDHVAILDHGRLKAAPTRVLLGSFTANTLRVVW
jgi:hypothetical protein